MEESRSPSQEQSQQVQHQMHQQEQSQQEQSQEHQQEHQQEQVVMPDNHPLAPHPPLKINDVDHPLYDPNGYLYISNFPSSSTKSKVKTLLESLGVNPLAQERKFQKKGLYLRFASPAEATEAKRTILRQKSNFIIDFRKPKKWDMLCRAREQERVEKRMRQASTVERTIEDQVTPLAKLTYLDQLKQKQAEVIKVMEKHMGYRFLESWVNHESMPSYLVDHIKRVGPAMIETRGAQFRVTGEMRNTASKLFAQEVEKTMNSIEDLDTSNSCSPQERTELLREASTKSMLLPYKFLPIVSSPQIFNYRNNCEFSCGVNKDNEKSVGFLSGLFSEGFVCVESPANLKHISQRFIDVCERMELVVRKSPQPCYSKTTQDGFWRMIKVRSNRANEMIIMVQTNTTGCSLMEINDAKQLIIENFTDVSFQREHDLTIKGILFQEYDGVSNAAPEDCPLELISGEENIYEEILGKRFRISMKSFFQVNTLGAEKLYSIAINWAKTHCEEALLLDVCCGTGTIGIIMSQHVEQVAGLEINADAVKDAGQNASLNNVTNIEFVLGKAEGTIADVVSRYSHYKNIVAIVDPPRAGLHKTVLTTLRTTKEIDWLVYVSCGPGSLAEDVSFLCGVPNRKLRTRSSELSPFYPIQQVPVDMFPHTKHCENVVLLRRWRGDMVPTSPYKYLSKKIWQIRCDDAEEMLNTAELYNVKLEEDQEKSESENPIASVNTQELVDVKEEVCSEV